MAQILVVDDEFRVRELLAKGVRRLGHEVEEAESADAALIALDRRSADVVFTDVQMPGHDGRWLTSEVRRRYPYTAVILATTVSTVEPQISMQWGVVSYLVKPFTMEDVSVALTLAIDWHTKTKASATTAQSINDDLDRWLESL